MNRIIKATILVIAIGLLFYNYLLLSRMRVSKKFSFIPIEKRGGSKDDSKGKPTPEIAMIFDGMGSTFQELNSVYSLGIPVTVSIVPGLKFSRNVAYIARRCGFDVLIHIPTDSSSPRGKNKDFYLEPSSSRWRVEGVMRYAVNYVRIAKGIIIYPGFEMDNNEVIKIISSYLKRNNFVFVSGDKEGEKSLVQLLKSKGVKYLPVDMVVSCNGGDIKKEITSVFKQAQNKGKIVVLVCPGKEILDILGKLIPLWKGKVNFVTIGDYLALSP